MKKVLIVFALMFMINVGCKKIIDTNPVCACSPIQASFLSLVIKDSSGADLLNPATPGYLNKEKGQIQLYTKDANNAVKQITFGIRQPFSYGSDKFTFYQLTSDEISALAKSIDQAFYLKLGDDKLLELNLEVKNIKIEKLLVNKVEAPFEHPTPSNFTYVNEIFSLKL